MYINGGRENDPKDQQKCAGNIQFFKTLQMLQITISEMPTNADHNLYFPCENLYSVMKNSIIFYQNL